MDVIVSVSVLDGANSFNCQVKVGDRALKKVLSRFNPSEDGRVTALKALSAAQIQMMLDHQNDQRRIANGALPVSEESDLANARSRFAAIAITEAEKTQMCLVKSLFAEA
jgi:hypothetical protein